MRSDYRKMPQYCQQTVTAEQDTPLESKNNVNILFTSIMVAASWFVRSVCRGGRSYMKHSHGCRPTTAGISVMQSAWLIPIRSCPVSERNDYDFMRSSSCWQPSWSMQLEDELIISYLVSWRLGGSAVSGETPHHGGGNFHHRRCDSLNIHSAFPQLGLSVLPTGNLCLKSCV